MGTMHEKVHKNYPILQAVFNIIPEITFVKNKEFVYIAVSERFAKSVGKTSASEIIGKTDFEIFENELAEKHRLEDRWILLSGENMENIVERFFEADGTVRYDSISKYFLSDENGNAIGVYGVQCDVTRDVLAQQQYDQEINYLFELDENVYSTHLIDVDIWQVVHEKRSLTQIAEIRIGEGIEHFREHSLESVYSIESEAYSFYKNFTAENIKAIYRSGKRDMVLEYRRIMPNGKVRWIQDDIKFIRNPQNGHLFLAFIIRDIENRKRKEQELIRRAETDGLTGLLNRAAFLTKVERILKTEGEDGNHALFIVDVDNFKKLNDTHGHHVGDQFLVEMSKSLKSCFRNTDVIGRLGGDEFLILMRYTPGINVTTKNAMELLKNIKQVCNRYSTEELSISVGISTYPKDGNTFEELYKQADKALYSAKRDGKNRYKFA